MNRMRRNPYGYPVWAPKANVVEDAIILADKTVPEGEYVRTYSAMVTDFNYVLPESLNS